MGVAAPPGGRRQSGSEGRWDCSFADVRGMPGSVKAGDEGGGSAPGTPEPAAAKPLLVPATTMDDLLLGRTRVSLSRVPTILHVLDV